MLRNGLLNALGPLTLKRVEAHLESVEYRVEHVVCDPGASLRHAYFPVGGLLSIVTVMSDGRAVESTNIGREGAFGLFAAMYGGQSFNRCILQLAGPLLRCPIDVLHQEFQASDQVRGLFVGYAEAVLAQTQQIAACNALHRMDERMARWLLRIADQAGGRELEYTHEFLAHILGANRKSITLAAQALQTAGLIGYHRGSIEILDRSGLEKASCECYGVVVRQFRSFLDSPVASRSTTSTMSPAKPAKS